MAESVAAKRDRCDVAIVGYGPVGAALANLLGQAGLSVMVFERDAEVYALPRAIHFDGEVMRVFHSMGLAQEVGVASRPGLTGMHRGARHARRRQQLLFSPARARGGVAQRRRALPECRSAPAP